MRCKIQVIAQRQLRIEYDPFKSTSKLIGELLYAPIEKSKCDLVAKYIVWANLSMQFPDKEIRRGSFGLGVKKLTSSWDFLVGDTVFNVAVSHLFDVCEKCKKNIEEGFRVYLLVPYEKMEAAKQMLSESGVSEKIAIQAIELFVGQNIDELTTFSQEKLSEEFRLLLETYNQRVEAVEMDKSMMVEIPPNLH